MFDAKNKHKANKYARCWNCGGKHLTFECDQSDHGDLLYVIFNRWGLKGVRRYLNRHPDVESRMRHWHPDARDNLRHCQKLYSDKCTAFGSQGYNWLKS